MTDRLGGNTEDLLALQRIHPDEQHLHPDDRENRTRRFGRCALIIGSGLCVAIALNSLIMAVISNHTTFVGADAQLFATLSFVALAILGGSLIVVGGLERINRGERAQSRENHAAAAGNQERLDYVIGLVAPVSGRMAGIEDRLEPVEAAITSLAVHLPDTLQREHWMGFNDAVREGFTSEKTGTEGGSARRSRHLGIAPVKPNDL